MVACRVVLGLPVAGDGRDVMTVMMVARGAPKWWRSSLWQARLMEKWGRKNKEEEREEERVTAAGMEEGDAYQWV